jgi:hypothetical protein
MSSINNLLANLMVRAITDLSINPTDVENLGIKNIHYYRSLFVSLWTKSAKTDAGMVALFQILMNQKNITRLQEGMALMPSVSALPAVKEALEFIRTSCVKSTPQQAASKIATVKIPDSFPEIVTLMYILSYRTRPVDELVEGIITALWSSSLGFSAEVQASNKAAVKTEWDKWGKTSGVQVNSKKETIKFDEEIYLNQESDKIFLISLMGRKEPYEKEDESKSNVGIGSGYNKARLELYVKEVIAASSALQVPNAVAVA